MIELYLQLVRFNILAERRGWFFFLFVCYTEKQYVKISAQLNAIRYQVMSSHSTAETLVEAEHKRRDSRINREKAGENQAGVQPTTHNHIKLLACSITLW